RLYTAHAVFERVARGQHEDRHEALGAADGARDRVAVHVAGEHDVEDDDVYAAALEHLERLLAGAGDLDLVPGVLEVEAQPDREVLLVLDDQHAAHDPPPPAGSASAAPRSPSSATAASAWASTASAAAPSAAASPSASSPGSAHGSSTVNRAPR